MTIAAALILIAIGAILKFAITADVSGVDLGVIGVILMIIGGVGFIVALVITLMPRRTETISRVDDGTGPRRTHTTYSEPRDWSDPRA